MRGYEVLGGRGCPAVHDRHIAKARTVSRTSGWLAASLHSYGETPIVQPIDNNLLKPVRWVGSSNADLKRFPDRVRRRIGFAIHQAQAGLRHSDAKPLRGFGSGVLEVVARHDGDTFRAVYAIRFEAAVYVLHAFQKKSGRGVRTPRRELDLIARRLRAAERHHMETSNGR